MVPDLRFKPCCVLESMQETLFSIEENHPSQQEASIPLNTAFVRSRASAQERDLATELAAISASPAARAILRAARELAREQKLSELEASEQIIQTFRKLDEIWGAYLLQEGLAQLSAER